MGKTSTIESTSRVNSPNLELSTSMVENKTSPQKKQAPPQTQHRKSITVFKQLIIITTVVFSFGGLGFGVGLRFSNLMDIHKSQNTPLNHISD
ncbi:hypothetical protein ACN4EE_12880 [Geminocystis sp. CENA526]|uniref:hypothetical protein n=1 Tax=Geminocystis sp. CENA526 TaxID=1355871 RepID=UPI003D6FAEF3